MDVKAVQSTDWSYTPSTVKPAESDPAVSTADSLQTEQSGTDNSVSEQQQTKTQDPTEKELEPMTRELNKFFQYLNADLKFQLHERTNRLIVQIVDTKTDKVLREFPPHELLDKIANFREYVGVLLDKKA